MEGSKSGKKKPGVPKGKKATKIVFDETDVQMCETYASVGLTLDQIAAIFKVAPPTLDLIIKRQKDVAYAIKRGRALGIGNIAKTLYSKAIEGNMTAAIFYLKTQGRWVEATDQGETIEEEEYTPPSSLVE